MDAKRIERKRRKWINEFTDEFLRLEKLAPIADNPPHEDCPAWLWRVQQEYVRATHPTADLADAKVLTPARLGGLLGHQCANAVWMMELHSKLCDELARHTLPPSTPEQEQDGDRYMKKFDEWYTALRHLAGRVLKSVVYQSYEDMSAFLLAYSNAFSRKPNVTAGLGDFGSTTFAIYHFMLVNWRIVDRLASVKALHEMLRKYVGEYRTGDLKRVEKICQRIGLHYRKRGRPKKLQNAQTLL